MRAFLLVFSWGVSVVHAALNANNGTHAVGPVADDDPSPIGDPATYYPDQHDCPLACTDMSNVHSWITYFSVERLERCTRPMLLQFSVLQPLDDAETVLIRGCTLQHGEDAATATQRVVGVAAGVAAAAATSMENPKKAANLVLTGLESAPACVSTGSRSNEQLQVMASGGMGEQGNAAGLLQDMRAYFSAADNCDETFLFGYHNRTVAGVYIGSKLAKATADSALKALAHHVQVNGTMARTVAELCNNARPADGVFGLVVDTTSDLAGVQQTMRAWSQGHCEHDGSITQMPLAGAVVHVIHGNNTNTASAGSITGNNGTTTSIPLVKRQASGTCATHLIANGDTCSALALRYGVTVADIEKWNKGKTWAWTECKDMLIGYNLCVSDGAAPMPPPQTGTECGPLVPGTKPPLNSQTSLASLNPCPLKACCSNWGFCGVFPAHCSINAPKNGGPGSKLKEFANTCVANCGNEILQNSGPPAAFQRIGYYESYNFERECLHLKSKNANTDGSYTHMHWAFAEIDPITWKPIIKDPAKQWAGFKKLSIKRIVSFGGWALSTDPASYNIIRQAIINNCETFATNLAQFAEDEGLDGIDIDWEYPGAPDILVGGQPIGKASDGLDYLKFLTVLKKKLCTKKSVSIAAPASYWYLKAFPIDRIASVIDYIVYMTYDLHGQWDYGNPNSFDMCPSGKCIRSHGM
jgi:LysM repeat protein